VRQIVAMETAMEILAALASDTKFAQQISKAVAARRAEFGA
jgi:hypothetical protein